MLTITNPVINLWDEKNEEFIYIPEQTFVIEHSLVSISKWESKFKKPYISKENKTREETIFYLKCMTLTDGVDQRVYEYLTESNTIKIKEYIEDPLTATRFSDKQNSKGKSGEQITSELIYFWMIANNIPSEYQYWPLNRLLTLIKICGIKNQPKKKSSRKDILSRNARLNEERCKRLGTTG